MLSHPTEMWINKTQWLRMSIYEWLSWYKFETSKITTTVQYLKVCSVRLVAVAPDIWQNNNVISTYIHFMNFLRRMWWREEAKLILNLPDQCHRGCSLLSQWHIISSALVDVQMCQSSGNGWFGEGIFFFLRKCFGESPWHQNLFSTFCGNRSNCHSRFLCGI